MEWGWGALHRRAGIRNSASVCMRVVHARFHHKPGVLEQQAVEEEGNGGGSGHQGTRPVVHDSHERRLAGPVVAQQRQLRAQRARKQAAESEKGSGQGGGREGSLRTRSATTASGQSSSCAMKPQKVRYWSQEGTVWSVSVKGLALLPNRRGTHPEEATEAGVSRQCARVGREEVPPDGLGVHDAALCAGGRGNREAGDAGCQSVSASHGRAVCQGQQVSRPDWAHAQRGAAPNRRPCARWRRPGRGEPGTQGPCPARLAQVGAE